MYRSVREKTKKVAKAFIALSFLQKLSSLTSGSKLKRETSKGLLHGTGEQGATKLNQNSSFKRSVAISSNVPVQVQEDRHLATAEGNNTVDEQREEVKDIAKRYSFIVAVKFLRISLFQQIYISTIRAQQFIAVLQTCNAEQDHVLCVVSLLQMFKVKPIKEVGV